MVEAQDGREAEGYVLCKLRTDIGLVPVRLERQKEWTLDGTALAFYLSSVLQAVGGGERIVDERLWRLGSISVKGARADVFLARGTTWPDAGEVFGKPMIAECARPIVLVPLEVPRDSPFSPQAKALSLSRLLVVEEGVLRLDVAEIAEVVMVGRSKDARDLVPVKTAPGATWEQVTIHVVTAEEAVVSAGAGQALRTFRDLGFADRRTGGPDEQWALLLAIATQSGSLSWRDPVAQDKLRKRKKQVSKLRKALKAAFGIETDPIPFNRRTHQYEVKFAISDGRDSR